MCLKHSDGTPKTDAEIVKFLVEIIESIDREQLVLSGVVKEMEEYILNKYGEIYDADSNK